MGFSKDDNGQVLVLATARGLILGFYASYLLVLVR